MADSSPALVASVDDSEYLKGWPAQHGAAPAAPETIPGNVVLEAELPYKESLARTGINPADYTNGVVVAKDEAEKAKILHEAPEAEKAAPTAEDRAASPLLEVAPTVEADAPSTAEQNAEAGKAAEEAAQHEDTQPSGDAADV